MTRAMEYLDLFWPSIVGGVAIALTASLLSPFVVLKRLAFIGQGVSHAAFGGVGLAVALGVTGAGIAASTAYYGLIGGFSIATAIGIALLSGRDAPGDQRRLRPDTVIGVFLVASMALGAVLLSWAQRRGTRGVQNVSIEDWLFGSITVVGLADAVAAVAAGIGVALTLWIVRRPLMFWAIDESGARGFGVSTRTPQLVLLVALGVAIVVSMKLAGAVLATALLVLPGASALQVTRRLGATFVLSGVFSVVSMVGGLVISMVVGLPAGACIVGVLVVCFSACCVVGPLGRSGGREGVPA